MGCLKKTIILSASLIGGYYLGSGVVNNNTETKKYEIKKQENNYVLRSKELNKEIPLRTLNNNTYGGTLEHIVQASKVLREKETLKRIERGKNYE